ncbi:MAG TPA: pitrilysin family protein [Rubrivivax sp.]|nr:pitrilysin family protein [Rubrivivax sp.]
MNITPAGRNAGDPETTVTELPNGVRVVAIPLPHLQTASVGVFVRAGSAHEPAALNGVSHFVEHMVFKGTATRDVHRINLDAERLGAEVNAHTDKDHTASYMRGRGEHAGQFVQMLADIVQHATFPDDELEREREVLLQEAAEVADDPMDTAYQLFDHACWGLHAAAQPVIGCRRNIERLQRADLVRWVDCHYTGASVVVAAAGPIDSEAITREVQACFGSLPRGQACPVAPPVYAGGVRTRRLAGSSQTHLVLGFPLPPSSVDDPAGDVAAAVFGEGMSSPLLSELRERRGLAYHAACVADRYDLCGQFTVEASIAPDKLEAFLSELMQLLRRQAAVTTVVDLERARNPLAVRLLRDRDRPSRRMEQAALDLFALGRVRAATELLARIEAVSGEAVSGVVQRMLEAGVSLALTGSLGRAASERARASLLLAA